MTGDRADIAVVGAGAAGLMAAIWAGRTCEAGTGGAPRIVALDGARKLGAKILVAGGGRCNVTHDVVDETAFAGSTRPGIRKVLGRFGVAQTVAFFRELGVELKREETGKLFPTTDDAHTVLEALLGAARRARVELVHPWRVEAVKRDAGGFVIERSGDDPGAASITAGRVILAAGAQALPKSGSDGHGYAIARSLGHSTTGRIFPGLVPLTLPHGHFLCGLSGIAAPATLELRAPGGKRLANFSGSVLCTHFGLSGPAVLDISRYCLDAAQSGAESGEPAPVLLINWLPGESMEAIDGALAEIKNQSPGRWLTEQLPERLARALCEHARVDAGTPGHQLSRPKRRALAEAVGALPLPVTGSRGFTHAEVTAGGVPLSEVRLDTMESRVCPGLYLCGEILDVDGRIGGYNFQWAWASGYVAGVAGARPAGTASPVRRRRN